MPRKRTSLPLSNPALDAWWRNALTLWEISLATPLVIARRSTRMAQAGASPSARDRREFAVMGAEKVQAFSESMMAAGVRLAQAQVAIAASMMQPVHRRVTSNARRLGRVTPRRR